MIKIKDPLAVVLQIYITTCTISVNKQQHLLARLYIITLSTEILHGNNAIMTRNYTASLNFSAILSTA